MRDQATDVRSTIQAAFVDARDLVTSAAEGALPARLETLSDRLASVFRASGKIIVCGNGGSMADGMHFAEELSGRFREDRPPLPALAVSDPTYLTCVGNDFGFSAIFSRAVTAFAKPEDLLLLLTTSGESENLILAAEAARGARAYSVAFTGKGGGRLGSVVDESFDFPGATSDRIQEIQMLALHALVEAVELRLAPDWLAR